MITKFPHHSGRSGQRLFSRARALLAVSALAALAVSSQALALTLPPPINLGPGDVRAVAQGYVVGTSNSSAYVWSAASGKIDLGALLPSAPADAFYVSSAGISVNSHGEVVFGRAVGQFIQATQSYLYTHTVFYWSQATGVVTIGATGNFDQLPFFINESGVVAGLDDQLNTFRWTRTGGVQSLGVVGAIAGINARGDIAINAGLQAYIVWGNGTPMTTLNSPGLSSPPPISVSNEGQNNIQVNGINDSGVVAGTYWDYRYMYGGYDISQGGFFNAVVHNSHAFKWTSSGGITDLGNFGTSPLITLPYPTYSSFGASANAINNDGTIVGYSYLPNGSYVPFVYKNGTMSQLPKLNLYDDYATATGINNDGVVAGSSGGSVVLWENGVPTNIHPTFAGSYSYSPLISGSTFAGIGETAAWTFVLPSAQPPPATPPVIFTRTSANGEGWKQYTVAFSPTHSGNYTLGFNITGSVTNRDSSIFLDDVKLSAGATDLFSSGFESSVTSGAFYKSSNGTATPVDWIFTNFSGVLYGVANGVWDGGGSPGPHTGNQRGIIQTYNTSNANAGAVNPAGSAVLSSIKTVQTFSLVAGQTYTVSYYQASRGGTVGDEGVLTYTVTIDEVVTPAPVVTSNSATGTFGTAFSYQIAATNSPTGYTATGLPAGLSVNTSTGVISGTPTQTGGPVSVALSATNAGGTGTGTLSLTINKKSATVALSNLSHTYDGTAKSATATTSNPSGLTVVLNYVGSQTNAGNTTVVNALISDANYTGSINGLLDIAKASSSTTTVGAGPFTYSGSAYAGGSGTVAGAGVLAGTATVTYSGNQTNAGTYTVTAHYAGDANHAASVGSPVTITINKANATVVVTPYNVEYDGLPHSATATINGVGGQTGAAVGTVTLNTTHTSVGTYLTDSWSFTGTGNYNNIAVTTITDTIKDTTAPVVTASLVPLRSGGDDESTQKFTVVFSATDLVGVKTLTATLNGLTVTNGQIVQLQLIKSGKQESEKSDGILKIKATSLLLTVTALDAAGNKGTATAAPVFNKNGKDSEDKKSDVTSESKKDDDKSSSGVFPGK